ncbi:hypothetical protein ACVNS2_36820 [Paenibacillus caseinilyticus]|nr:hypothetical protein [Paenibacillus mucilaginosus]
MEAAYLHGVDVHIPYVGGTVSAAVLSLLNYGAAFPYTARLPV